ncbi:hypothetical protein GCM10027442_32290 [Emticicia fontis]
MILSSSGEQAKDYFKHALQKSDYYVNDQELQGRFDGRLAERLGISGIVTQDIFNDLCDNINPKTGKSLTLRTNDERRVGYDINFHCPKSVSILNALSKDDHLLKAFEKSVRETMEDIEKDMKTRVRLYGQDKDRETGELVWAAFTHQTARPVDNYLPDPHLHAHCFVFNATWDDYEKRFKAGQFGDIKRDMPYYQARFQKRFSDSLDELGYGIQLTKNSFEIVGVPQKANELFSKRTDEIGRVAKEKGITNVKQLDQLGARTRSKKQKGLSMDELRVSWKKQIHELEAKEGKSEDLIVRFAPKKDKKQITQELCVDYALKHSFERASVCQDRRLLAAAYRFGIGHANVSVDNITEQFKQEDSLIHIKEKGKIMTTTRQVLSEEQRMVRLAQQGKGKLWPLYMELPKIKATGQAKNAIEHVLSTTDRVSIVSGKAGTGKTTILKELVPLIEQKSKNVTIVAASADASRGVLREEGFQQADTVTKLLTDKKMQTNLLGQVLIVDEAGTLGTKDMASLLELANNQNARLILIGDTRQHSSVDRGDAQRILNTVGNIKTAEVSKIYRQQNEKYKRAVEDLSVGNVSGAFEKLDDMGAIKTINPLKPYETLVKDYIETLNSKKSVLVISPTHQQSDDVTMAIREKLKSSGMLGKKELEVSRLQSMNLTEAQKGDWRNFKEGQVIGFNQNLKNVTRGSLWTVKKSSERGIDIVNKDNQTIQLPMHNSKDFDLYEKSIIHVAKNDIIRITKTSFDNRKNRLENRQMYKVLKVNNNGTFKLKNVNCDTEVEVNKDFGHLTHAYCITSHASQGKTVDEVLIAQPASTFPATDSKQVYVSVSRGRERVRIYTDDKDQLMEYASQMGDRQSAIELVHKQSPDMTVVQHHIRRTIDIDAPIPVNKARTKDVDKPSPRKDRHYEPRI